MGEELQFNLSHCRGAAACAISRFVPVGVDIENISRQVDFNLAPQVLSDRELDQWHRLVDDESRRLSFLTAWTMKEAASKVWGEGLRLGMASLATHGLSPGVSVVRQVAGGEPRRWLVWSPEIDPGYLMAVAIPFSSDLASQAPGIFTLHREVEFEPEPSEP
jgi:4'-phosphopantetheinyl transferase